MLEENEGVVHFTLEVKTSGMQPPFWTYMAATAFCFCVLCDGTHVRCRWSMTFTVVRDLPVVMFCKSLIAAFLRGCRFCHTLTLTRTTSMFRNNLCRNRSA